MKHSDFYSAHLELDRLARLELKEAIMAQGGIYCFFNIDDNGDYDVDERDEKSPIISAATAYDESYGDYYVSRVMIDDDDRLFIYGLPKDCAWDELELDSVAVGHIEYIIDYIEDTEDVNDVSGSLAEWKLKMKD